MDGSILIPVGLAGTGGAAAAYGIARLIRRRRRNGYLRSQSEPDDLDLSKGIEYRARWLGISPQAVSADPSLGSGVAGSRLPRTERAEPDYGQRSPGLFSGSTVDGLARTGAEALDVAYSLLERTTAESVRMVDRLEGVWENQAQPMLEKGSRGWQRATGRLGEVLTNQAQPALQRGTRDLGKATGRLGAVLSNQALPSLGQLIERRSRRAVARTEAPRAAREKEAQASARELPPAPVREARPEAGPDLRLSADEIMKAGERAVGEGKREMALQCFARVCQLNPVAEGAWLWRAALAATAEERISALQEVLSINPDNRRAEQSLRQAVAQQWEETGMEDLSVEGPRDARAVASAKDHEGRTERGDIAALLDQGKAALEVGQEEMAHRIFVKAIVGDPRSEQAWLWRARVAEDVNELVTCLERVVEINPSNATASRNLDLARTRQAKVELPSRQQARQTLSEVRHRPARRRAAGRMVGDAVNGLAAVLAVALGVYWLSPGFVPGLVEALSQLGLGSMLQESEQGIGSWMALMPQLDLGSQAEVLSPWPGFGPSVWIPYVVGYFASYAGIRLMRRGRRGVFWGIAAALVSGALAVLAVQDPRVTTLAATAAGLLGVTVLLSWLIGRLGR